MSASTVIDLSHADWRVRPYHPNEADHQQAWKQPPTESMEIPAKVPGDVVTDVMGELARRRDALVASGIDPDALVLDPGLGFAKLPGHKWRLLAHLGDLESPGLRVLVGASRRTFLGPGGRREAGRDPVPFRAPDGPRRSSLSMARCTSAKVR